MSVVTDPEVEAALRALLENWRMRKRWDDFPPDLQRLHHHILREFLRAGAAPLRFELAGLPVSDIDAALADLAARDLVVLGKGGEIAGAYPFSSRPTRHAVAIEGTTIPALCAIDALGAGAMAGSDSIVTSRCADCDKAIRVETGKRGLAVIAVQPQTALVWAGVTDIDGCAADTQCQTMLMFCDDGHLESWRAKQGPDARGFRLTPDQGLQAGAAIFRPFLAASRGAEGTN